MPRSGTLVFCCHNLDFSGANQVILNIVAGTMHEGNVVILAPALGPFASRFVECGASVRTGILADLLHNIRDVFCVICNTIMTAPIVVEMHKGPIPVVWIIHEWWTDEMITANLSMRNVGGMSTSTVKKAMATATHIVFVCENQRQLYQPTVSSSVIYVGVPAPPLAREHFDQKRTLFNFLCLGIVCPRKNQVWAVQLFKAFAGDRSDLRLLIVGVRQTRQYETEYVQEVLKAIDGDSRIEMHDVTTNVDQYYAVTDVLLFTSTNEVTPMVISEAMSYGIPVVATNIAGIPEMVTSEVEGFLVKPGDTQTALDHMKRLYSDVDLRKKMGSFGKLRFQQLFDLNIMIENYRQLIFNLAPPTILIDMDGTLVDWDKGFYSVFKDRCVIDRTKSYFMEDCVSYEYRSEALRIEQSQGFFRNLPIMPGAVDAISEMLAMNLQEKIDWIREHLGDSWVPKLMLMDDKTKAKGDILIDDKPMETLAPEGKHRSATWKQVVFSQPYNLGVDSPRLVQWKDWKEVLLPLLGKLDRVDARTDRSLSIDAHDMRHQLLEACSYDLNKTDLLIERSSSNLPNGSDNLRVTQTELERIEKLDEDLENLEKRLVTESYGGQNDDSNGVQLFRDSYKNWRQNVLTPPSPSPVPRELKKDS